MEVNVFLISNPGDFDKEKKLLSLNVFEPLKKEIKGVSLNFFDLVEVYDKTDKESVAKKAYYNSPQIFEGERNLFIICLSDSYGYVPSQDLYDKFNYFNNIKCMPKDAVSLVEYQAILSGAFDDNSSNQILVLYRTFTNRPDYPHNHFVEHNNHERLRDLIVRLEERNKNVQVGDYPASFTSDDDYYFDEEGLVEGITNDIKSKINKLIDVNPYLDPDLQNPHKVLQEENTRRIEKKYAYLTSNSESIHKHMTTLREIYLLPDLKYSPLKCNPTGHGLEKAAVYLKSLLDKNEHSKVYIYDATKRIDDDFIEDFRNYLYENLDGRFSRGSINYLLSSLDKEIHHYFIILYDPVVEPDIDNLLTSYFKLEPNVSVLMLVPNNSCSYTELVEQELPLLYPGFDGKIRQNLETYNHNDFKLLLPILNARISPYYHLPLSIVESIKEEYGTDLFYKSLKLYFRFADSTYLEDIAKEYRTVNEDGLELDEQFALLTLLSSSKNGVPYSVIKYIFKKAYKEPKSDLAILTFLNDYSSIIHRHKNGNYKASIPLEIFLRQKSKLFAFTINLSYNIFNTSMEHFDKDEINISKEEYYSYVTAYQSFMFSHLSILPSNGRERYLYFNNVVPKDGKIFPLIERMYHVDNFKDHKLLALSSFFRDLNEEEIMEAISINPSYAFYNGKDESLIELSKELCEKLFATYIHYSAIEKAYKLYVKFQDKFNVFSPKIYAETLYLLNLLGIEDDFNLYLNRAIEHFEQMIKKKDVDDTYIIKLLIYICSFKKKKSLYAGSLKELIGYFSRYALYGCESDENRDKMFGLLLLFDSLIGYKQIELYQIMKDFIKKHYSSGDYKNNGPFFDLIIYAMKYYKVDDLASGEMCYDATIKFFTKSYGYNHIEYNLITPIILDNLRHLYPKNALTLSKLSLIMYKRYTKRYDQKNILSITTTLNVLKYYHLGNIYSTVYGFYDNPKLSDFVGNSILKEYIDSLKKKYNAFITEFELDYSDISEEISNILSNVK